MGTAALIDEEPEVEKGIIILPSAPQFLINSVTKGGGAEAQRGKPSIIISYPLKLKKGFYITAVIIYRLNFTAFAAQVLRNPARKAFGIAGLGKINNNGFHLLAPIKAGF